MLWKVIQRVKVTTAVPQSSQTYDRYFRNVHTEILSKRHVPRGFKLGDPSDRNPSRSAQVGVKEFGRVSGPQYLVTPTLFLPSSFTFLKDASSGHIFRELCLAKNVGAYVSRQRYPSSMIGTPNGYEQMEVRDLGPTILFQRFRR